jgi:hypothetical protein
MNITIYGWSTSVGEDALHVRVILREARHLTATGAPAHSS